MQRLARILLGLAVLAGLFVGPLALDASASGRNPGSLLLYPIYDSRPSSGTLLSIANTSRFQDCWTHWIYIDGEDWQEFNRFEYLTPGDQFTTSADFHNPNSERGFLYVIALDPDNGLRPFDFDFLIGDEIVLDGSGNFLYSIEAISFLGLTGPNNPTDVDTDNVADLNGAEYESPPDLVHISSFFGQTESLVSQLILVSLVGSGDYRTEVDFEIYNNNEIAFSASLKFRCWVQIALSDINNVFDRSFLLSTLQDDNPSEFGETGWARIDGDEAVDVVGNEPKVENPPVVGAIVHVAGIYAAGHLLHEEGLNSTPGQLER